MKRVLLHVCCGPCAIYPFRSLKEDGFDIEGFFYNPNIQPKAEYLKREEAVKNLKDLLGIKVYFGDYQEELYIETTQPAKHKNSRCRSCFKLRLENTHSFALDKKFDFFTTTLLVSPYQDQEVIKEVGSQISKGSDTQFLFYDFRLGFREGHIKARELKLYCQKYCGCLASLKEKEEDSKVK